MKKAMSILFLLVAILVIITGCAIPAATVLVAKSAAPDITANLAEPLATAQSTMTYKDGIYNIKCAHDSENYYVKGSVTIKNGKVTSVEWAIYDASRSDKLFDKNYEEVFAGNEMYIQQCRDNLTGMVQYTPKLIDTQDINAVDSISGATWTYNKFKQLVVEALMQASTK